MEAVLEVVVIVLPHRIGSLCVPCVVIPYIANVVVHSLKEPHVFQCRLAGVGQHKGYGKAPRASLRRSYPSREAEVVIVERGCIGCLFGTKTGVDGKVR